MQAEVVAIGAELTSGYTVNTNAAYLARRLQDVGIPCLRHTAVPDERAMIIQTLRETLSRADLLLVTGGLGPTFDDVTMEAIAAATGRRLVFVESAARRIRAFYRAFHRRLNRQALRQAYLPEGGAALPNPVGTAPGLWLALGPGGQVLVALPGVPQEMRAIVEQSVLPRLRRLRGRTVLLSRTLRTAGLVELQIQAILKRLAIPESIQVGLYPHLMTVDVRLTATARSRSRALQALSRVERRLRRQLGQTVYGLDDDTLEAVVGRLLVRRRWTVAVAESCTGGVVSDRLTNIPGSSRYLLQSVLAYHNHAKARLLGIRPDLLRRYGAVSAPVAQAMAHGIRRTAGADLGLAITGIAGPGGGSRTKPVGLVYLALADRTRAAVRQCQFHGDRLAIKHQAAQAALDWLRRRVLAAR